MSDEWIIVPNWDKFQHYTDRDPVWIKVYAELNSRDDWRHLTYESRGLVVSIWIEYGRARGQLRVSDLGSRCGQRVRQRSLTSLSHAGFIELSASKPLALARSRDVKTLREEKKAKPGNDEQKQSTPKANCPTCGVPLAGPRMLAEHLYLSHDGPEPAHWLESESKADLG